MCKDIHSQLNAVSGLAGLSRMGKLQCYALAPDDSQQAGSLESLHDGECERDCITSSGCPQKYVQPDSVLIMHASTLQRLYNGNSARSVDQA